MIRRSFCSLIPLLRVQIAARTPPLAVTSRRLPVTDASNRLYSKDNVTNRSDFTRSTNELYSNRFTFGNRMYYLDLKVEPETDACFVQLAEVNRTNKKRSAILIGLTDLEKFVNLLADCPHLANQTEEPFATLKSKMFDGKVVEFVMQETAFGKSLELREYYESGIRAGMVSRIFVDFRALEILLNRTEELMENARMMYDEASKSP